MAFPEGFHCSAKLLSTGAVHRGLWKALGEFSDTWGHNALQPSMNPPEVRLHEYLEQPITRAPPKANCKPSQTHSDSLQITRLNGTVQQSTKCGHVSYLTDSLQVTRLAGTVQQSTKCGHVSYLTDSLQVTRLAGTVQQSTKCGHVSYLTDSLQATRPARDRATVY